MIIGISGKANSGKDTLADMIIKIEPSFKKEAFAGKLKYIASILTGWPDQYTRDGKSHYLPEWGMTVGEFQQKLGTDAIRNGLRNDAWIIALLADYSEDQRWVISDLRFPNEAQAIRKHGGILVRISRKIEDDCGRDEQHLSEIALDEWGDWDYIVDNNSDLGALARKANEILEEVC